MTEAYLTDAERRALELFEERMRLKRWKHNQRLANTVTRGISPAPYRFLGLHWAVWPIMSLIAGAGWIAGLPL